MQPKLTIDRDKGVAVIELPLSPKGTMTKNGKSQMIATTRGTVRVMIDGQEYKVGANVTL